MTLANSAERAISLVAENSPAILTALGCAGVVSTAVLAARGGAQAYLILDDEPHDITLIDSFKKTWKVYVPAAAVGAVAVACIIGAHTVSSRRNAALISLYTMSEKAFTRYRDKVIEEAGPNKEQKIRDEIAQDYVSENIGKTEVIFTGNGNVLCMDSLTGRFFESNQESIRRAMNDVNAQCINQGYASQNDFYHALGMPYAEIGETVGWSSDHLMDLTFSSALTPEGKPCLAVGYAKGPRTGFNRVW